MVLKKDYREIFGNIDTTPYREAATRFLPDKIKVLFIFESPPFEPPVNPFTGVENPKWSFFYRTENNSSNKLRGILCNTLFNEKLPAEIFLRKFADEGYFLVDAVSYPINDTYEDRKHLISLDSNRQVNSRERIKIIQQEAGNLVKEINFWTVMSSTDLSKINILVIAATVFEGILILDNPFKEKLKSGVFNVLNKDEKIYYPSRYSANVFRTLVRKNLKLNFAIKT